MVPPLLHAGIHDLPDVPPFVWYLLGAFLTPILAWLETLVYRPLLTRCADHPLVFLAQWYDPSAVVAACAGFHHVPTKPGRPPTFTIAPFVRMEIVRTWADTCSDRDREDLRNTNLLVRWSVGLPLTQPAPDHRTLAAFPAWLTMHAPNALFCDVLRFLDRVDPEDPATTPQIVDTFAMESPVAATPTVAHLLAHLTLRLVHLWQQHAPAAVQHAIPPLDLGHLADLPFARTATARQQRLQTVVTVVGWVVDGLTPHLPALDADLCAAVPSYLDALAKVQADALTTDATGFVTERPTDDRGTQRLASAVNREATFRTHEGQPAVLGWNAVVSTTATRIRAVVALTGATSDSDAPIAVLKQQSAAAQPLPEIHQQQPPRPRQRRASACTHPRKPPTGSDCAAFPRLGSRRCTLRAAVCGRQPTTEHAITPPTACPAGQDTLNEATVSTCNRVIELESCQVGKGADIWRDCRRYNKKIRLTPKLMLPSAADGTAASDT